MEEKEVKKSLKSSIYDGAAFAVLDGMTASFITPFAVALNASVHLIAALSYIPQLASAFIQLLAAKLVETFRDRRKILMYASFAQAVLWIPLLLIPYLTPNQKYLLVVYICLQSVISNLMNPVWNSLMGDIVPKYERGKFFGMRNRIVGLTSFLSAILAGFLLDRYSVTHPFLGFTILFSIAVAARLLTGIFRGMLANPPADLEHEEHFSLIDFIRRMDKTNYGHFVIYMAFFKFAVNISAPFFVVYMLKSLNFSYFQFTAIIAAELIASFVAMTLWGRMIDERGTKTAIYISGFLVPVIPFLWLISPNFYYLLAVELFAGFAWAGFNLSSSNFIFDAVKPENRVRCTAYFKFFEGIALFFGALLGGFLVDKLPAWIFASSIMFVFFISGVLRMAASIFILPTLREARLIELGLGHSIFKRFIAIKPQEGLVFEVLGKYHKMKEKIVHTKDLFRKNPAKSPAPKKEKDLSKERLLKFIDKNISQKKDDSDITSIHKIEKIAEDIEKGKLKK